jgi:membrane-associated phospholipid phosphatase
MARFTGFLSRLRRRVFYFDSARWMTVRRDFANFYALRTAAMLGIPFATAAALANTRELGLSETEADEDLFQLLYTDEIASSFGQLVFASIDNFGDYGLLLYLMIAYALGFKKHFWQCWRVWLVAQPVLLLGQQLLGGHRPVDRPGPEWIPFGGSGSHAISGHALVGAIPFLLLAQRSRGWKRWLFYAISLLPACGRLFRAAHFPSQVMLGWCLAYTAARAVLQTDVEKPEPTPATI